MQLIHPVALRKFIGLSALAGMSCFAGNVSANLVVTEIENGTSLASTIVGTGISISNVSYIGEPGQAGIFTGGVSSGLGIDSGVILSTGTVSNAVGPNAESDTSTDYFAPGYAPLDTLSGSTTFDATVLSFDFEFDGGTEGDLFFNFIFGSEEYNEFVTLGFNDVFAFYVDGVNVATLPDDTPISVDSVNNLSNSALYNDNELGQFNIEFDGFTNSIQISVLNLNPGTHTMEFALADAGDDILDSWILIEADSFADTAIPIPAAGWLFGSALAGLIGARTKRR